MKAILRNGAHLMACWAIALCAAQAQQIDPEKQIRGKKTAPYANYILLTDATGHWKITPLPLGYGTGTMPPAAAPVAPNGPVFVTNAGAVYTWNGTAWAPVAGADNWGAQTVQHAATMTGNGTAASPLDLARGSSPGDVLTWNGTTWLSSAPTTDDWGTQTAQTDATLLGNGSPASPLGLAQQGAAIGQVLAWNGTAWAPVAPTTDNWGAQTAQTDATLLGNGTPASPLGLAQQGAITGQVLAWNGTAWAPVAPTTDNWGTQTAQKTYGLLGDGTASNPLQADTSSNGLATAYDLRHYLTDGSGTELNATLDGYDWNGPLLEPVLIDGTDVQPVTFQDLSRFYVNVGLATGNFTTLDLRKLASGSKFAHYNAAATARSEVWVNGGLETQLSHTNTTTNDVAFVGAGENGGAPYARLASAPAGAIITEIKAANDGIYATGVDAGTGPNLLYYDPATKEVLTGTNASLLAQQLAIAELEAKVVGTTGGTVTFTGLNAPVGTDLTRIEIYRNGIKQELTDDYAILSTAPVTISVVAPAVAADKFKCEIE